MTNSAHRLLWAVQPGTNGTRPVELSSAVLRAEGRTTDQTTRVFHGRTAPTEGWVQTNLFAPGRDIDPANEVRTWLMSPVYERKFVDTAEWVDFYDDWSLAPDINQLHRLRAARTYAHVASHRPSALVTCNSPYMARKLGLPLDSVVPNGVDVQLSELRLEGTDVRRLIIQGHFFRGRTDFDLLARFVRSEAFEEIVLCAPGSSREIRRVLEEAGARLRVVSWMSDLELAKLSGSRTVALIPHLVRDYTLSQDLMKAYKYLCLGIRVIAPRLLWPAGLRADFAYLLGYGAFDLSNIVEWLDTTPAPSASERHEIVRAHSWDARATAVQNLMERRHGR